MVTSWEMNLPWLFLNNCQLKLYDAKKKGGYKKKEQRPNLQKVLRCQWEAIKENWNKVQERS